MSGVQRRLASTARAIWSFATASPLNGLAVILITLALVCVVFGPLLAPYPADVPNYTALLQAPSVHHLFGTDEIGRDLFSRALDGAHLSVEAALEVLIAAVVIGTLLGLFAGLTGGLVDDAIMRLTDLFLAFPALVLAAAVAAVLGPSLPHTTLSLAVVWWPWYARLVRGQVLSLREREFLLAAEIAGVGRWRLMWRHVLPNVRPLILVQASSDVGNVIIAIASLGFLGLGAQPPEPEWGALITSGAADIQTAWWYALMPGTMLFLTVLGCNLLGDGLNEWFDPRAQLHAARRPRRPALLWRRPIDPEMEVAPVA